MNKSARFFFPLFFLLTAFAGVGQSWGTQGRYLTKGGEKVFFSGVNYVPSHGWLTHLEIWDPAEVEKDFVNLRAAGVRHIRYLPLWHQLQKSTKRGHPPALERLDKVIELAGKHGIAVQLGLLNSWMSGGTFLPEWADGKIFTDRKIVDAQKNLIRDIVSRYKGNTIIQAYDVGNELNVLPEWMKMENTKEEIESWMKEIYETIKKYDPTHDVINGVGTGYTANFNIEAISRTSDMMASHSYPYFHGTSRFDPWIGQRTTYSTNFIISWAEMTGMPVLMQELGSSEQWMAPRDIPKYLEITFMSNWAEGAAGYLWWCSHDLKPTFRVADQGLFKKYSTPRVRRQNQFSELNYDMGILDNNNQKKPAALVFKKSVEIVDRLGLDWKDQLPVCYILVPEDYRYQYSMIHLINPFTLAKQAHMDVKMLFETDPVPADAASVVIAGFRLGKNGKDNILKYLDRGGTVYQSFYNDFASDIKVSDEEEILHSPSITVDYRKGLFSLAAKQKLPVDLRIKKVVDQGSSKRILSVAAENIVKQDREHDTDFFEQQQGAGLLYQSVIGKGQYYYFTGDLERSLLNTYGGWDENDAYMIYSVLRPDTQFDLSEKQVELYHKTNETDEIVVLINHSNDFRNTTLYSTENVSLTNVEDETEKHMGTRINLQMKPAEVRILKVSKWLGRTN